MLSEIQKTLQLTTADVNSRSTDSIFDVSIPRSGCLIHHQLLSMRCDANVMEHLSLIHSGGQHFISVTHIDAQEFPL